MADCRFFVKDKNVNNSVFSVPYHTAKGVILDLIPRLAEGQAVFKLVYFGKIRLNWHGRLYVFRKCKQFCLFGSLLYERDRLTCLTAKMSWAEWGSLEARIKLTT